MITGNGIPHEKYNICGIAHECTNRKDDIFMKRRLYIDEAHRALEIFRFAVFFYVIFEQCLISETNMIHPGYDEYCLV